MKIFLTISTILVSSQAFHLNCFYWIFSIPERTYACQGRVSHLTDDHMLIGISGNHLPGFTNEDVNAVDFLGIRGCDAFTRMPNGLARFFPNIQVLFFELCGIHMLSGMDLSDYPNLTTFGMIRHESLERIPGNFFRDTPNIRNVMLGYNQIRHVGANLLNNLNSLQHVDFRENQCINQIARSSEEIPDLIQALQANCPDDREEPPTCELHETVCNMSTQIELLRQENAEIKRQLDLIYEAISNRPC